MAEAHGCDGRRKRAVRGSQSLAASAPWDNIFQQAVRPYYRAAAYQARREGVERIAMRSLASCSVLVLCPVVGVQICKLSISDKTPHQRAFLRLDGGGKQLMRLRWQTPSLSARQRDDRSARGEKRRLADATACAGKSSSLAWLGDMAQKKHLVALRFAQLQQRHRFSSIRCAVGSAAVLAQVIVVDAWWRRTGRARLVSTFPTPRQGVGNLCYRHGC